ncbi:endonuclease NucS domain-containing protein [Streptomyces harbinensis]|uniref:endonuclease NucS domain-containing protein n=1 Tax=Streptomyces harbinensis TaxID=1176198 RepID=UPI00372103F0
MPLEFGLWRIDGKPERVPRRPLAREAALEDLIVADPDVLGRPLLLIGRQVHTGHNGFIDLLAMDEEGALHVLELKRDRTPREVVAQILDYGSWVRDLGNEDIRALYAHHAREHGLPTELDEAFAARFGGSPPDTLNSAHTLTVVAGELDAATERIITYLATGFGVPVNVMFFRTFEDDGRSYLARTWLIDEPETAPAPAGRRGGTREPWNGTDWYVSFGDESGGRDWDDARRHGFVSAGGGDWFSRTLRALPHGARVFTHIPKSGYVGVGTVAGPARPFEDAELEVDGTVRRLAALELKGTYTRDGATAPGEGEEDRREWVVPVSWERTVPRELAVWRPGFFANQNSACKLRARFTAEEVTRHFGLG